MKENFKSGFTAIIGRPNVGKSTLMNHLIGQKIAITSKKPQTTRNRIQTVYTCEDGQIVFLDTPGIHKAKNKLGEYMVQVAERTLKDVDVILWLRELLQYRASAAVRQTYQVHFSLIGLLLHPRWQHHGEIFLRSHRVLPWNGYHEFSVRTQRYRKYSSGTDSASGIPFRLFFEERLRTKD